MPPLGLQDGPWPAAGGAYGGAGRAQAPAAAQPLIDRFLRRVAPRTALRRAEARAALLELDWHMHRTRRYEAASSGRRTQGWLADSGDANAEIGDALDQLRNRSRQLVRDNHWAGRAVRLVTNHTIGTGIVTRSKAGSSARRKRLDDRWKQFSKAREIDESGYLNWNGLSRLGFRSGVEGGDFLIRRLWTSDKDTPGGIPFRMQLLEGDHLATEITKPVAEGGMVWQGVEVNARGRPVAYHLRKSHPGAPWPAFDREVVRVDARDVLHPFRIDRIGQRRGVPWGAAAMLLMRDWDLYKDAQLLRQRIAACFVAFEHDISGDNESTVKALPGYTKGGAPDGSDRQHIEPGLWAKLTGGRTVTFGSPPGVDGYKDQFQITAMDVAVAFDLTYQQLTGDLSQANYSSMRGGNLEQLACIEDARWNLAIPQMIDPVWRWFVEGAMVAGIIEPSADLPDTDHTPPRVELLDPKEEIPAAIKEVRAGFSSWQEKLRSWGLDPEQVAAEIAEDSALFDALSIALDSDGRRPQQGGAPNPPSLATGDPDAAARAHARLERILERRRPG